MAETKAGKERVWQKPYTRRDGTRVKGNYRTPPCPSSRQPKKKG
jgi:hypothetical protein